MDKIVKHIKRDIKQDKKLLNDIRRECKPKSKKSIWSNDTEIWD